MILKKRMRRLRNSENIRALVRENSISIDDLILPYFVVEGIEVKNEIESMPGVFHFSVDLLLEELVEVEKLGIKAILIFGVPNKKDEIGSQAFSDQGIVQKAIKSIKKSFPKLLVITDVCLCAYTLSGHCGLVVDNKIDNDTSVELIVNTALSHAIAGADIVAPSDMMDGRIGAIRSALDAAGFENLPIMAYSAKYASNFYGPFRDAAHSAPSFGDRKEYQMDTCNVKEAMREIELDIEEGADIVMVKPALAYLDVIKEASLRFEHPIAAYNVSGEYAMIKAAARNNWIDEKGIVMEIMNSMKRAGANIIITYFAKDIAKWLER